MDLSRPFIRLPFAFDAARMAEEVAGLSESAWMAHPSRMTGNAAVALVSRDAGDNDHFDGPMLPTPHLDQCPYIKQAMASFGEVLGRSRLMRLTGGAEVSTHVDFNYHWYTRVRIHIPITTNPRVTFYCADEKVHMQAGQCWIFNSWRRHRVTNESDLSRVHLVLDTAGSSRFWTLVRKMEQYDPLAGAEVIEQQTQQVDFEPDAKPQLKTERYNISPVMSPGEVDALVHSLIAEFEPHPGNDPKLVQQYKFMLESFAKDWREVWALHGYRQQGWPHYQALIDSVQQQLMPNPRALITSTNQIGVNPIIVQRILRAALATERMQEFTA